VIADIASHTADSIEGSTLLYLEPLGGTRVRLNMQEFIDTFRVAHPTAVIHYAELILPVRNTAGKQRPNRIMALKYEADGTSAYVTDANYLANPYTYTGYDGYYHPETGYYRLRITRHLQELLRCGKDYDTELVLDERRSSSFRTVLNGYEATKPVRVELIYSE